METNSVTFFRDQNYPELPYKPIVAAWKVKNPQNVGSLMRLTDNVGGNRLILLDDENPKRESSIKKTAGLSFNHVELEKMEALSFFEQIPEGYQCVALETNEQSTNIFTAPLPGRIVFLLGSEMHGLPEDLIRRCHQSVHIPMTGLCKSMNISQALAVGLFEWQRQQLFNS